MGEIKLWAIGIAEVREMFAASPALTRELVAHSDLHVPPTRKLPGLLGKLGPLLRVAPDAPVVPADRPTRADADNLLQGRFVSADRLDVSWGLVEQWLAYRAWSHHVLRLDERSADALDFDLARAGVASRYGVRHFWSRDASLPLRPIPGMHVGYLRYGTAVDVAEAWSDGLRAVEAPSHEAAAELVRWLAELPHWSGEAAGAGRPQPDVVTIARL